MKWPVASPRRLLHALFLVFFLLVVRMVGFVLYASLYGGPEEPDPFAATGLSFAMIGLCLMLYLVGLSLLLVRWGDLRWEELGWRPPSWARDLGLGVAGFALCSLVLCGTLLITGGSPSELIASIKSFSPAQRLLFIIIGLQAAFAEETVFRGYLQPTLSARLGVGVGLLTTAAIFSVYHLQFHPVGLIGKLLLGVIFGGLFLVSRSLWPSAIAHFLVWAVLGAA